MMAQDWAAQLYNQGLIALPCWGGGKTLPGTCHRQLADNPPSEKAIYQADYSGGLSILLGTHHSGGGFVTAMDIDEGPISFMKWPKGLLLAEHGTSAGKWHIFLTTIDRLQGQINLRDEVGDLVAEIKGYGLSMRSWPTIPIGKPRGYRVVILVDDCNVIPVFSVADTTEWLRNLLSSTLKKNIQAKNTQQKVYEHQILDSHFTRLAKDIEAELLKRGVSLRPSGRDGWQSGKCPFHHDVRPSFSISFELGAWKCWSGCGSGYLPSLARRLGISNNRRSWEVRG